MDKARQKRAVKEGRVVKKLLSREERDERARKVLRELVNC